MEEYILNQLSKKMRKRNRGFIVDREVKESIENVLPVAFGIIGSAGVVNLFHVDSTWSFVRRVKRLAGRIVGLFTKLDGNR